MSATEFQFDQIANAFYEKGKATIPLEEILRDLDLWQWDVKAKALTSALAMRGLTLINGELSATGDAASFIPVKTGFDAFIRAAKNALDMVERPVPAAELIGMTGLASEAVPEHLAYHLRRVGIYHIPGVGYWRHPQYATTRGELLASSPKSKIGTRIVETFQLHGWPLAGEEIEKLTAGEVTSRTMSQQTQKGPNRVALTLGNSLFIPAGVVATDSQPIPMTANVVEIIMDHPQTVPIFREDNVKLYKLAFLLAKHNMAVIREHWERRGGRQSRAVTMALTEDGRQIIAGMDKRRKDDF